ncbi:MAG TPA: MFS transporter [Candidatus Sulfotelmatobacter sp.]|jgi:predicted MFS family arabinose efflux permease|nr:MFS transporter [Candidatus Sulfotelmatobacter sp.]
MPLDKPRAAVTVAGFCAFLDLYAPQVVMPQLAESFHVSEAVAASTVGISTLAVAISAPLAGLLTDKMRRKPVLLFAVLALVLPTIMLVLADSLTEILVWRFIQGMFLPAIFSATVAYISEEWPSAEASGVTGYYIAGSALGGFSGRFVTALMTDHFGWKSGSLALTLVTLLCALIIWRWLPPGGARKNVQVAQVSALEGLRRHLTDPALLATYAVGFSVLFSMVATFTYVNFHLSLPPYSMSVSALGMIFLVYPIGAFVTPASGFLIRRLGRRGTILLALSTSGAGLLATLGPSLFEVVIGLAMFVTGVFVAQTSATGYVGQRARVARTTAVGIYVCCYYLGGSVGAELPGLTVWHAGGWPGCVGLVLAVLAGAASLAWWAWRPQAQLCPAE